MAFFSIRRFLVCTILTVAVALIGAGLASEVEHRLSHVQSKTRMLSVAWKVSAAVVGLFVTNYLALYAGPPRVRCIER